MTKCVAVILASGDGRRAGFERPKQLAKLAGKPVVAHTLERFQSHPEVDEIAVVTNSACLPDIEALVHQDRLTKVKHVLLGGVERHESSLTAIRAYEEESENHDLKVLFHDAVRPLVSARIISDVIKALDHYSAVDTAVAATDTVIFADPTTNTIEEIPDRRLARLGQTPQGFRYEVIKKAYEAAIHDPDFRTTDDCGVVLKYLPDVKTYVVDGALSNLKLTYADDLLVLDKYIQTSAGKRLNAEAETLRLSQLDGKTLVIIGGTSGIGESMARLAKAYGANAHVASRSTGTDITNPESIESFFEEIAAADGQIHAVVNAAAVLSRQPLINMRTDEIADNIDINITGAINVARISYDYLERTRGHLMMFTSSSYTYGRAFYSTYSSAKAAVVNLTQALADEWMDAGIKVNCLNPERARTPMRTKAFGQEPPETLLDPDEIARRALGVLTGQTTGIIYDVSKNKA